MAKIKGQLESAQAENLASDPSNLPNGRFWLNRTTNFFKGYIGSAIRIFVTTDQAQTLTNKTISGSNNTITDLPLNSLPPLATEMVVVTSPSGTLTTSSSIDIVELAALNGISGNVQGQLDEKIGKSIIDAKGDLLVGTANDTVARLPAGTDGYTLTADSSQASGVKWSPSADATGQAAKNHLINSHFDLWQRGTTNTCANGNTRYQADRWYVKNSLGTNGVITFSRTTGVVDGSKYGASVQITTAPTAAQANGCELYQTLENIDSVPFYNKSASFGIQVKALGNVNQVGVQFMYKTTEAKVDTKIGTEQTVAVNSSTFTLASILNQALGTSMTLSGVIGVRIRITGVSSGNLYALNNGFIVEQAQMHVTATLPDSTRYGSYSDLYNKAQRFFQRWGGDDTFQHIGPAFSVSVTTASAILLFPRMRIAPSNNVTGQTGFRYSNASNNYVASSTTLSNVTKTSAFVNIVTSGITAGALPGGIDSNNVNSYIDLDAEI